MLFSTFISTAALPLLALASPIASSVKARAGAPAIVPLPANCTLTDSLPHASDHPGNGTISGWKPTNATLQSEIYEFFLEQPDFYSYNARYEQCLEQCHGLSGCKSVFFSNNAIVPAGYYFSSGGEEALGCIMFSKYLTPYDFEPAANGTYVNATSANIYC